MCLLQANSARLSMAAFISAVRGSAGVYGGSDRKHTRHSDPVQEHTSTTLTRYVTIQCYCLITVSAYVTISDEILQCVYVL